MNKNDFIGFLQNPDNLSAESTTDLVDVVAEFPYCQTARMLLTINLFKERNIRYDSELRTTAVYVCNRGVLKKHLDRVANADTKVVLPDEEVEEPIKKVDSQQNEKPSEVKESIHKEEPNEDLELEDEAIAEVKNIIERHLFELEEESRKRKALESEVESELADVKPKTELIDDFIKNEPSISRPKAEFYDPVHKAKESIVDHENIVSETLANIFYDQGHTLKAIKIYKKLSLKFPEKSSYFAALIKKAEKELES